MKVKQTEYTLKVRLWGYRRPLPENWHVEALERISGLVAEGYTSGEVVHEAAERGWWESSHEETSHDRPSVRSKVRRASRPEATP